MTGIPPSVRADLEELKAEYFFCVDNKLWDRLLTLFTPDAAFHGTGFRAGDPGEFVKKTSEILTHVHSSHFGFQPVFSKDAEGTAARGRWAMQDFLTWDPQETSLPGITNPGAHSLHGFGYYEDSYRFDGGRWRLSSMRLIRTRLDVLAASPAPTTFPVAGSIDLSWVER